MVRIQNGDHNGTWTFPGYFQSINKCIYEVKRFKSVNSSLIAYFELAVNLSKAIKSNQFSNMEFIIVFFRCLFKFR